MRTLLFGTVIFLFFLFANSGHALTEIRQGSEVVIAETEEINDDVYVFAQSVNIDGTIKGDLIFFGQQITINGSVEGDLIAAAQSVTINGKVSDDARIAGQVLTLQNGGSVGDDLIASSYSLECTEESQIGGEVKFAGQQAVFAGRVEKKVEVASSNCQLSGSFGGDIVAAVGGDDYNLAGFFAAEVPQIPIGLTVTESAEIAGNLNYQSTREADISPESTIGGDVEQSLGGPDSAQPPTLTEQVVLIAKQIFALFVVGLLVVYICPGWTGSVVNNVQCRPVASLGFGVLALIVMFSGAILMLVTTIAIAVMLGYVALDNLIPAWVWLGILSTGMVFVSCWIFSAWVAKVIVGVWVGNRIISGADWNPTKQFLSLAIGAAILGALSWIPSVGAVVSLLAILIGIGSTVIWLFNRSPALDTKKELGMSPDSSQISQSLSTAN